MLLTPDCCNPAFIIYGIWVDLWDKRINLQGSSHSILLSSTEAEESAHHWPWLVGHYSRYQRPAATKKMMEGSYRECQVWWIRPHPIISAVSRHFNTTRYQSFTVVPILQRTTHLWQIWCMLRAGLQAKKKTRQEEQLKELQLFAASLWAAALPSSGSFAPYGRYQPHPIAQQNTHGEAEPAPLRPPAILAAACAMPMGEVAWWDPAGGSRSWGPGQGGVSLLAPGTMPLESQLRQCCLALLSLEGKRSRDNSYALALPTENMFFLLIVAHAEKTPKSPLQRKPLGVPDVG